jgi:hypothetical protein
MSDTLSAAAIATGQDEKIRQRAYEIWERGCSGLRRWSAACWAGLLIEP